MKKVLKVKFYGIDSWCRPIFKAVDQKEFFGSTWNLFGYGEGLKAQKFYCSKELLNTLVYFGSKFDCEPLGLYLDDMNLELELVNDNN